MATTPATEAKWSERVRAWRESGVTAAEYAEGKGFEGSTLRYWASELTRLSRAAGAPRILRVVTRSRSKESSSAPAAAAASSVSEIVVEVGSARVRVGRGFDRELLGEVVQALGGESR